MRVSVAAGVVLAAGAPRSPVPDPEPNATSAAAEASACASHSATHGLGQRRAAESRVASSPTKRSGLSQVSFDDRLT